MISAVSLKPVRRTIEPLQFMFCIEKEFYSARVTDIGNICHNYIRNTYEILSVLGSYGSQKLLAEVFFGNGKLEVENEVPIESKSQNIAGYDGS